MHDYYLVECLRVVHARARVLEIGDCHPILREAFPYTRFLSHYPTVPGREFPFETASFDVVLCPSGLQHDPCFWITFLEMCRVLTPSGILYVQSRAEGAWQRVPGDHWRFTGDAGQALAAWATRNGFPTRLQECFQMVSPVDAQVDCICVWSRTLALESDADLEYIVNDRIRTRKGAVQTRLQAYAATRRFEEQKHSSPSPSVRLAQLHRALTIHFGDKYDEYAEQLLAVTYIQPHHRVLELGGNIGRNSCVIASLLNDSRQLVVFESCPTHARELEHNRELNGLRFQVEPCALSNVPLIQQQWNTIPCPEEETSIPEGWSAVPTLSYTEFRKRYADPFDVLVADCEGALYGILRDMPDLLQGTQIVILENDFFIREQGLWVHDFLRERGFVVQHTIPSGWGHFQDCFYQVWSANHAE